MSDFIYCPICEEQTLIDDASYLDFIEDDLVLKIKEIYPNLSKGDMICFNCERNFEENHL